jgi:antitoxin component of MazEF toxin-antitoxin module
MSQQLRQQAEYVKVQKHSENRTLMVTIPYVFAQSIPIQKGDTVKMTLENNKRIVVERTAD